MTIRAGIIGCGDIAGRYDESKKDAGSYTHAGAYRVTTGVDLVAAADPDADRLAAFGRYWEVPHLYADARELLRHHALDVVSVCVPDTLHEEVIELALEMGQPRVIYAEKPLALGRNSARRLLDRARARDTYIVLNNQRRWEEGHRKARDIIQAGGIGEVVTLTTFYVKGLYHIGCTVVDIIRFLVSEVDEVQALAGNHQATLPGDPSVDAALYLRNGATVAMMGVDRYGYRYSLYELDILGTAGRIRLVENGDRILVSRVKDYAHYSGFQELTESPEDEIVTNMGEAIPNGVRQIVRFLTEGGDVPDSDGEEGYRDLCILDAIAASKAQGGLRVAVESSRDVSAKK